jgi:hypothetical protein
VVLEELELDEEELSLVPEPVVDPLGGLPAPLPFRFESVDMLREPEDEVVSSGMLEAPASDGTGSVAGRIVVSTDDDELAAAPEVL